MFDSPALYPRPLASVLQDALADTPVVCVTGPRQSGKSTLVRAMMPARPYFSLDHAPYLAAAKADPAGFVAALPREVTIDEIQRAPELLPAIKLSVDLDRRPGRFVLTGSANLLLLPTVTESLAGRMEIARLMPLSEAEKERRRGLFLTDLVAGAITPVLRAGGRSPDPAKSGMPTASRVYCDCWRCETANCSIRQVCHESWASIAARSGNTSRYWKDCSWFGASCRGAATSGSGW